MIYVIEGKVTLVLKANNNFLKLLIDLEIYVSVSLILCVQKLILIYFFMVKQ